MIVPEPSRTSRAATTGWALFFALFFAFFSVVMVVDGLETALHFQGSAIDGPFQLYNALRRIYAGQRAGVDFQFFHGLGIPFLHYIPFRLLGGTFFASEITRELVTAVLYPITLIAFLRFFIGNWTRALVWSGIVMALSIGLRMAPMLVALNSLLGVRSTLPTLVPIFLCLSVRRSMRTVIAGIVLGAALVMSTEQGLAAVMAVVLATIVASLRRGRNGERREYLVDGAAMVAIAMVTLVSLLTLLGGTDGMRGALRYNFSLVPKDQYWYFGAPPNLFLSSWGTLPAMLAAIPRIPLTLFAGIAAVCLTMRRLWRSDSGTARRREFAFTVLALYGLISCASLLGTFVNAYVQPLLRVLLLLGAVYLDHQLVRRDARLGRRPLCGVSRSTFMVACASALYAVVLVPAIIDTVRVTIPHMVRDHLLHRVGAVYDGIWPQTIVAGQAMLDSRRDASGRPPVLWSTYAGLLEARNGLFHPSVDYIIHALGPQNRAKYVDDFRRVKPRLVQTVDPLYTQYEAWIEDTSWDFYVELLRNYELVGHTPWSLFWERRAAELPAPVLLGWSTVAAGTDSLRLPTIASANEGPTLVLLQVELQYRTHNPLQWLPIVGATPRYLVTATGAIQRNPVTIDPYTMRTRFPLLVVRGATPVLHWQTYSLLPGARLDVSAVRLTSIVSSPKNDPWLEKLASQQIGRSNR